MPRNLILCFDGTSNQFGEENTSVVRLAQVLDRNPDMQRLYYDPGLGTLPEPGVMTRIGRKLSEVRGLMFGAGLMHKVEEAYTYLMNYWEPGDKVFLFGFSRGAYTARVLAGVLHKLGLLPRGGENLVPYVMRLYKAVRKERKNLVGNPFDEQPIASETKAPGGQPKPGNDYWQSLSDAFRWSFARQGNDDADDRRFRVRFLGLWDTVSSVGWVWEPAHFPYTTYNPTVDVVRHAVSIDERRSFFRQNLIERAGGQDLEERWFAGVHEDIGGGYPAGESGIWRAPFKWVLESARRAGLNIDPHRLAMVLNDDGGAGATAGHTTVDGEPNAVIHNPPPSARPWDDPQHESLTPAWWLAEFFPKGQWNWSSDRWSLQVGLGRRRSIQAGAWIDGSALRRIREIDYAPPNLSSAFLAKVRTLAEVPDKLAYEP